MWPWGTESGEYVAEGCQRALSGNEMKGKRRRGGSRVRLVSLPNHPGGCFGTSVLCQGLLLEKAVASAGSATKSVANQATDR